MMDDRLSSDDASQSTDCGLGGKRKRPSRTIQYSWSEQDESRLIAAIQRQQPLWDCAVPEYKSRDVRIDSWQMVAQELNIDGVDFSEARKKWNIMRSNFKVVLGKLRSKKSGQGACDLQNVKYPHFKEMLFIDSGKGNESALHMADTKKRSKAWQYFISLPGRKARCKFCGKILSFKGGGPFNLTRHIKSQHLVAYTASCEENKVADGDRTTMKGKQSSPSSTPAPTAVSTPAPAPIPASTSQALTVQKPPLKKLKSRPNPAPYTNPYPSSYSKQLPTTRDNPPPLPRQVQRSQQDREVHICSSCPCIAAQESEFDKIGKAWASELQKMTPEQQIYAKRAIAEIIFEGQLGALHRDSVIINHIEPRVVEEASPFLIEKEEPDFNC